MTRSLSSLLGLIVLIATTSYAQKQNNQWRFGYQAGLNFNGNTPVNVIGAALLTQEGSASVADPSTGNLLFYTDGNTVWNALNQVMPNGTGLTGGSAILLSSTTAAAILPKPSVHTQYYIFTIDEQFSSGNGLRYSIVDMSLNGGLGDVVANQKNMPIWQTESEKIEIVPSNNPDEYWIVTHDNPGNTFFSFLVDSTGIQTTPVTSVIGGTHGNGSGHLKINRQHNKLACGNFFDSSIELYDFNNATGVVSNFISWPFNFFPGNIYGVEFSPDGKMLYVSNLDRIVQYNISLNTSTAIANSAFSLTQTGNQYATLQLGPDSVIYCNAGFLGAISQPNNSGPSCNYSATTLAGGGYGLPKWVYGKSTVNNVVRNIFNIDSCTGSNITFSLSDTSGIVNVTWNFGNPTAGNANTANGTITNHVYSLPGTYTITAIVTTTLGVDTIRLNGLTIIDCTPIICDGVLSVNGSFCALDSLQWSIQSTRAIFNVLWDFGAGVNNTSTSLNPTYTYSAPGTYTVQCIVNFDCGTDTLIKTIDINECDTITCRLFVPNAFSPNNDGLNDVLSIKQNCPTEFWELAIFNRWGERVFYTNQPDEFWNGNYKNMESPVGIYFYKLTYKASGKKTTIQSGDVTLLR